MLDSTPLPLDNLPALLAGPVLRRLTRTDVTVWMALRVGDAVTLTVERADGSGTEQTETGEPVQIGSHLWILAVTAPGVDGGTFNSGQLYRYEISSTQWPTGVDTPNWESLAYGDHQLPTFLGLPDEIEQFQLLHMSCRKPHGGFRDAFGVADARMAAGTDPRPSLLVLSGDQIYADDVAAPLVPRVRRVAQDLIGIDESDVFGPFPGINGRQGPSEDFGMTSGLASNHLWTFGEIMAMYLLAWSDVLWPGSVPRWTAETEADLTGDLDEAADLTREKWYELADRIEVFKAHCIDGSSPRCQSKI